MTTLALIRENYLGGCLQPQLKTVVFAFVRRSAPRVHTLLRCGGSVLPSPASLLVSREPEGDVQWPLSPGWPHVAGLAGALPVLLPMVAIQQCQSWI